MPPPKPRYESASLREIIEVYREAFSKRCAENIRKTGQYFTNMPDDTLDHVCQALLGAIAEMIADTQDGLVDWTARYLSSFTTHELPYSEILYCLRELRNPIRDKLIEDFDIPSEVLTKIKRLDQGIDKLRTTLLNHFLASQEQRFHIVFEQSAIGKAFLDAEGRVLASNPALREMLGHPGDALSDGLGRFFENENHGKCFQSSLENTILSGNGGICLESGLRHTSGETRWAKISTTSVGEDNRCAGMVLAMFQDITQYKQVEEALTERIKELEGLYGLGRLIEETSDLETLLKTFVNEIAPPSMQYPEHILVSLELDGVTYVNRPEIPIVYLAAPIKADALKRGHLVVGYDQEQSFIPDFERRLVDEYADRLGHVIERVETRKALEESEERFRRLAENAQDMIYRMSLPDGRYEYVSPACEQVMGHPPEKFYAEPLFVARIIAPESKEYFYQEWMKVLNGTAEPVCEYKVVAADGTEKWLSQRNVMIRDTSGQPEAMEGIVTDVTERRLAERELKETVTLLKETGQMAKIGGWKLYPDSKEVVWTEETYNIHDMPTDYKPCLDEATSFFHSDDRPVLERAIDRALKFGHPYDLQLRFISATGRELWVRSICEPVVQSGQTVLLRGTFQDVTERKQIEEALRESQKKYRALFDSIRDAILVADTDRKIVHCNPAFTDLFGYQLQEIQGKKTSFVYGSEEDFKKLGHELSRCSSDGNFLFLIRYRKKSGEVFSGETNVFYLKNEQGEITGFIGLIRDITERIRAEEELRRANERLKAAQRIGKIGDWEWDPESGRVIWSEQLYQIMGLDPNEPPPGYEGQLALYHGESAARLDKAVKQALEEGDSYELELSRTKPDGSVLHLLVWGVPGDKGQGGLRRLYGAVQDITERKLAEERLKHRTFELEILNSLSRSLGYTLDYGELLQMLLANLHQVLEYDVAAGLLDREGDLEMTLQCAGPVTEEAKDQIRKHLIHTIENFRREPIEESSLSVKLMECAHNEVSAYGQLDYIKSKIVVPMFTETDQAAACILVGSGTENAFSEEMVKLLFTLADQASDSVQRLRHLLAEEEKGLIQLLETMPLGVLLLDQDLSIKVSNVNAQDMLCQITGMVAAEKFTDIRLTPLVRAVDKSVKGNARMEFFSSEGETVFEVWTTPLKHGPYAGGWVLIILDVTADRMAEQSLRRSEEKFRTLFDSSGDAIFVHDLHGNFLDVNKQACTRLGYSREELMDMPPSDIDSPEYKSVTLKHLDELRRRDYIFFETEHMRADGSKVPTEITARSIEYENRPAVLATARNITERKKAEEASKEREQLLNSMLQGIKAAFFIVDKESLAIVETNQMGQELIGRAKEKIVGRHCPEVLEFADADHVCAGGMADQLVLSHEHLLKRADGDVTPVSLSVLEMNIKGQPYYVLVCFDVSERKNLERQLSLAQKLESVGQLAAGIAHEINTPVQFIANNLDFLKEACEYYEMYINTCESTFEAMEQGDFSVQALKETAAKRGKSDLEFYMEQSHLAIDETQEGVERITSIVSSIKRFSHPGSEGVSQVDLNEAVESTVTVCRNEWKYTADMELDLDSKLPQVRGYPAEINQALLNLVVNAAHAVTERFTDNEDKGKITIKTYTENNYATIEIRDNGSGMPESIQTRIFDPFFTTKEVGKGTGQGLSIVHSVIVNQHGGELDFTSEPDKGTVFMVRIPFVTIENQS